MNAHWMVVSSDEESWPLASDEVAAVTPLRGQHELAGGVWLLECAEEFATVASAWRAQPPIFVRHVQPVQRALALTGEAADPATLAERLLADGYITGLLDPALTFSVQTRILAEVPYKPFDVNNALSAMVAAATGATLEVRTPAQVLSVACAPLVEGFEQNGRRAGLFPRGERTDAAVALALVGISPAQDNLSNWAGGMRRFAREPGQVSRSEFKLLEAFEVFGISLAERGVALDLGASPGGWTRVLRQRGLYVTAVDPGELDPRLAADGGIRHRRVTAEEYLRDDPDRFDVIVNDMRMDARDSARLMAAYARLLYPGGLAIMTLKLPEAGRRTVVEQSLTILRREFEVLGARQLFHNRSEVTVCLRRGR